MRYGSAKDIRKMCNSALRLSPQVKVVIGYNSSVIYDFNKRKAYQISKLVGESLKEGTFDKLPTWFLEKLREIGVLANKCEGEEAFADITSHVSDTLDLCNIELTSRCNFHCPHCYLGTKSSSQELDFSVVHNLLVQIHEIGFKKIHLTGGEICLRRDLIEIIQLAREQGLEIEMATNGSLISESLINVIKKYISKVQITLYALSKERYSKFSGDPDALNKVVSAIDGLKESCPGKLLVNFTLTPYNYDELGTFRQFAEERKLETTIGMTMPIGLALEDEALRSESFISFVNLFIEELEKDNECKLIFPFRTRVCKLNQITVLSDGNLTICPLARWLLFGNVLHHNLEELWYNKVKPFFLSLCVDKMEICKDCEYKYLCGGECPALWPVLEPIKRLRNPPCQAFFSTRRFSFDSLKY